MEGNIVKTMIVGHAVGDALGVPVEFYPREKLQAHPVKDMLGFGAIAMPQGSWSDATSLELACMDAMADSGFMDTKTIMQRFIDCMDKGVYTPDGEPIELGHSVRHALKKFRNGMPPHLCGGQGAMDNGCGALMRMDPVVLYLYTHHGNDLDCEDMELIHTMSDLTNANPISRICCGIYTLLCVELLHGTPLKQAVHIAISTSKAFYDLLPTYEYGREMERVFERIQDKDGFHSLSESDIKSSGFVLDVLEAVFWVLLHTSSYEEAVIRAVNLGNNTNVAGAVTGSLAAVLYGKESIPNRWLKDLEGVDVLHIICDKFDDQF